MRYSGYKFVVPMRFSFETIVVKVRAVWLYPSSLSINVLLVFIHTQCTGIYSYVCIYICMFNVCLTLFHLSVSTVV